MQLNEMAAKELMFNNLTIWIDSFGFYHKRYAFDRLKLKMVNDRVKRMSKSNFESIKSDKNNQTSTLVSYVSINDFKPILNNYSSVKIIDYETHGISTDLKANIAKKIEYSTNQIFDKETFLEIWMALENIVPVLPEKYPKADYANKKITAYHSQALVAVRKFTFTDYCKLNLRRKTGLFQNNSIDTMQHRKNIISSSLIYLSEIDVEYAFDMFEYLLKAAGQIQSEHHNLHEISKLIQIINERNDDIKEEAFVQVIKQMSSKKEIYVKIFCCLAACIRVPCRLYIPLLNYLYEEYNDFDSTQFRQYYNYAFYHLIRNFDKPAKQNPSIFQIYCYYNIKKIPIVVSFPKQKIFYIEAYTTVEELISELIDYYNLDPNIEYLLEINSFLMEKGPLLELYNKYSKVEDQQNFRWTEYTTFKGFRAIIVLKNVADVNKSTRCHNIMFNYCVHQYLKGLYSLKSIQIVKIAALKIYSELNDEDRYEFSYQNLISKRKLRLLTNSQRQRYKKHILKEYFSLKFQNKSEARKKILEILSRSKGFNTHFFKCQIFIEEFDQMEAWIGIQKSSLIVVEPTTGRVMRTIPYNKIRQWGKSKSEMCMKVDEIGQLHIDSSQIDVICSLFEGYLNYNYTTNIL